MPAQLPRLVAGLTEAVCGAGGGLVHTLKVMILNLIQYNNKSCARKMSSWVSVMNLREVWKFRSLLWRQLAGKPPSR